MRFTLFLFLLPYFLKKAPYFYIKIGGGATTDVVPNSPYIKGMVSNIIIFFSSSFSSSFFLPGV
jgi:hypothetical protein